MNDQPSASGPEVTPATPNVPAQPTAPVQPMAPMQPTGPAPAPMPVQPKKSRKKWIIGGIVAGAIVLLTGGGALAYNLWYQNPDKVVHDAVISMMQARSATLAGDITIKSDEATIALKINSESKDSEGKMDVEAKIDIEDGPQKVSLDVKGAAVMKDDTVYFKLDNLRDIVEEIADMSESAEVLEYLDPVIEKIDGQWISVKPSDYEDASKELSEQQECTQNALKTLNSDDAVRDEVIDLYRDNQMLIIKDSLGSKSINGVGSLGYEVEFDTEAAKGFVRGMKDTEIGKSLTACDDKIDFDEMADELDKDSDSADNDTKASLELWASRFGHDMTEIKLSVSDDDMAMSATINPTLNTDVEVEAPKDAISVKQLMKDVEKAIEDAMEQYYADMYSDYYSSYGTTPSAYNLN